MLNVLLITLLGYVVFNVSMYQDRSMQYATRIVRAATITLIACGAYAWIMIFMGL